VEDGEGAETLCCWYRTFPQTWCRIVDLDSLLVSLYVSVDDWWKSAHPSKPPKPGQPLSLSQSEVLTLAVLAQWPRFRSEKDFWRFASSHLRSYFPTLCSQRHHPHPRGRAGAGVPQGTFRRASGLREMPFEARVGLRVQGGTGGRPRRSDLRLRIGPSELRRETNRGSPHSPRLPRRLPLADKGFSSLGWEKRRLWSFTEPWSPPNAHRGWPQVDRRWAAGQRQIIEQVISQLKDLFTLECHRAKTLDGLLGRPAAKKIAAYTCGQMLNSRLGRPLSYLAALLVTTTGQ
jgi:hypothetical protein